MNLSGLIKLNKRVILIAVAFFFVNLFLITNYYYSHTALSTTLDHYKTKLNGSRNGNQSNNNSEGTENDLLEELFKSSSANPYEKYSIKYIPNYQQENLQAKDSTLFLSLISHSSPYGKDRSFDMFFKEVLLSQKYDYRKLSLGLLCITSSEYNTVKQQVKQYLENSEIDDSRKFNKITIIYAPFLDEKSGNRHNRQEPSFQKKRRSLIAKSRNFLINNVLEFENHLLTIDSDIVKIKDITLQLFLNSKKDIVVPRIRRGDQKDYDLNTWKGSRITPTKEEFAQIAAAQQEAVKNGKDEEYIFVPMDKEGEMRHLEQFAKELKSNKSDELVEVDSVGGAVLFLKSEIFRLGVQFPPYYVIGSDWKLPLGGYDGIETEGICYVAKIVGYKCWAMPNLLAKHSVE